MGHGGLDRGAAHRGYGALAISWDDRVRGTARVDSLLVRRSAFAA